MQYKASDWVSEFIEVGLREVNWLDMIVQARDVDTAMSRMVPEIQGATKAQGVPLTDEEEAALVPIMILFSCPTMSKHQADVQLYMEACLAHTELKEGNFLVTEDHKFFRFFLFSPTAEKALYSVATKTLNLSDGVKVKMAGELIEGM